MKGQPLVALLAVLVGWVGGRAVAWQPLPEAASIHAEARQGNFASASRQVAAQGEDASLIAGPQSLAGEGYLPGGDGLASEEVLGDHAYRTELRFDYQPNLPPRPVGFSGHALRGGWGLVGSQRHRIFGVSPDQYFDLRQPLGDLAAPPGVHGGLFDRFASLAGSSHHYIPQTSSASDSVVVADSVVAKASPAQAVRARRWSADAWAMMRRGSGGQLTPGVLPASYGASQAGAILRFRLDRVSGHRPSIYMRTTSTLGVMRDSAAALGFSARPLAHVPVMTAVEGRLTQAGGGNVIQPIAMAVTELPPIALPLNLRAEAYAQGGYVGGKYATPFADGQLRIDHGLFQLGPVETRLGGGAWGGIQKGASRLDVGPSATLAFPLGGQTYGRLAFDWRFRVAGDAAPGSGPAVTLSAGF